MTKRKKSYLIALLILGVAALFLAGYLTYQPPLLDRGGRNPLEAVYDYCAYSRYFTGWVWEKQNRDWPAAQRERLLMAWHRPSVLDDWEQMKRKSTFGRSRVYERAGLKQCAAGLYLRAHLENPHYRLLAENVARKLWELREWEKLGLVCRDIRAFWPDNKEADRWCRPEDEGQRREDGRRKP